MSISLTILRRAQVLAFLSVTQLWCQTAPIAKKPIGHNILLARNEASEGVTLPRVRVTSATAIAALAVAIPAKPASSSAPPAPGTLAPATLTPALPVPTIYPALGVPHLSSVFDALAHRIMPVTANIEVHAETSELATGAPAPFEAGSLDIVSTAGTFGDVSRYLQTLPGVVATSDLSNEVLVRGGHPMENLFLVDGIEVPNINHLATMGTTGGFGPMIDSAVMQGVKIYTGGFDARYPERLSSVTEIETLNPDHLTTHVEADLGIQGFGGLAEKTVHGGDLLVSAHHGLLEMMNTVGLGGLPSYSNEMGRYRRSDSSGDRFTILHLGGWDSVDVSPCEADPAETSTIDSQYSGWRETTGAEWQHVYSGHSFGVASISDSEQIEHIHQQEQLVTPTDFTRYYTCPVPASVLTPTPVYMEDSNDGFDTANYRFEWSNPHVSISAGSSFWLNRPNFQIDQPIGAFSPYSVDPVRTDSTSFSSNFSTGETGSYAGFTIHPLRGLTVSAASRVQTFAFGNHQTITPRASVRYSLGEHVSFHAAFAGYAQMPPFAYLLSYPGNRSMSPMRDRHEILGMDLNLIPSSEIHIEAYNKPYENIPASSEYPDVNLHDMVEMLGHQFVWLPMDSQGRGTSSGIEISDLTHVRDRLVVRASLAYSRAMFSGSNHVVHPSNYDFPWIANVEALKRFSHGYELSTRFGYSTGRPYTPYDMADSLAQNRPIYDITRMNSLRVPYYARMDAQMNKDAYVHRLHLEIYAGVNNLFNRQNFLSYVWMPRKEEFAHPKSSVAEIDQMSIFPTFGLRYIFR